MRVRIMFVIALLCGDRVRRPGGGGDRAIDIAPTPDGLPDGSGYWVFTDECRVIPFGNARFHGDMSTVPLNGPILDSVATPSGHGYWMIASDGGVFSFGDAQFYGSMGGQRLNQPVMSIAPDPDGAGYWLVASDGGIFAFSAPFYGSMGSVPLNEPVSAIVASSLVAVLRPRGWSTRRSALVLPVAEVPVVAVVGPFAFP